MNAHPYRFARVAMLTFTAAALFACASQAAAQQAMNAGQSAILEAVRQDLVRQRLDALTMGIEHLIRDLHSNALLDAQSQTDLDILIRRIRDVNNGRVRLAANALRSVADERDATVAKGKLGIAERHIDQASREIGSIMLQLGVQFATEVFGRELHEVVLDQQQLYISTMDARDAGAAAEALWKPQSELADWLVRLLGELSKVDDYSDDALAMVRLNRIVSQLRDAQVEQQLQAAARHLRNGDPTQALASQTAALQAIMKAEFRIRPGSEFQALILARDALVGIRTAQRELRDRMSRFDELAWGQKATQAATDQADLRRKLARVMVPPILGERVQLAQQVLGTTGRPTALAEPARVEALVGQAAGHMIAAHGAMGRNLRAEAAEAEMAAEQTLEQAIAGLDQRIESAMYLDAIFRHMQEAMRRLKHIQKLEEQQTELMQETEQVEVEKRSTRFLAMPQDQLNVEVTALVTRLTNDNQVQAKPSDWIPLVCRPMLQATGHMRQSVIFLKDDLPPQARPRQVLALQALGEARKVAQQELASWDRLWRLLQAVKDLEAFAQYLADLEAQQMEIRQRTQAAGDDAQALKPLATPQHTLGAAVGQARQIITGQDVNLSALSALMDQAILSMDSAQQQFTGGAGWAAVPYQKQAEQHLGAAQDEIRRLAEQFNFLAEWVALLQQLNADSLDLLQRQIQLRLETQLAQPAAFIELAGEQDIIRTEAVTFSQLFPIGQQDYAKAAEHMAGAMTALRGDDRIQAIKQMALAEEALGSALAQLLAAIEALDQVPALALLAEPPTDLNYLIRILTLASQQRTLRGKTRTMIQDITVVQFANPQERLRAEAQSIGQIVPEPLPLLGQAENEMALARDALNKPARTSAIEHQQLAEKHLRQLLLEIALAEFEIPEALTAAMAVAMPTVMPPMITMEVEHAFAKRAVEGDLASGGRTEWRVLGQRDRAALNQNFARELPLEYREVLRVYFERLSE